MKNIILIYPPNSSVYAINHQNDFLYYSEEFVVIPTGLLCLATYLKNNGDKLSFRCFAMDMNKNVLYIPAFGDLTGGYPCKKSFKKWAIVSEEEIIEIKS